MTKTESAATLEITVIVREPVWQDQVASVEAVCLDAAQAAFAATRDESGGAEGSARIFEACLVLGDDDFVAELNQTWRGRNGPTNVLSFAALDGDDCVVDLAGDVPVVLGDVVIALGVVQREAAEMKISLANHLRHLVVHGMLHLLGYDHMQDDEAQEMEGLETHILAAMGVDDPYTTV